MAADHICVNIERRNANGVGDKVAVPGTVEHAALADNTFTRESTGLHGHMTHGVHGIAENNQHGIGTHFGCRFDLHPDDLGVAVKEFFAAHSRFSRRAGGANNHI